MLKTAFVLFAVTSFLPMAFLDAGANEAGLLLFVAPVVSLVGLLLCAGAIRSGARLRGYMGLLLVGLWPYYACVLKATRPGGMRQALLCLIDIPFILLGVWIAFLAISRRRRPATPADVD